MGLAASQARFLSLTARLSDKEYEAQQISQERLALTKKMDGYAEDYEKATTNKVAMAQVFTNNGETKSTVALTWDVINGDIFNGGLGMKLVSASGKIVVPDEKSMQEMIEESKVVNSAPITVDGETPTTITSVKELTPADFVIVEEIKDSSVLQKNLENGNMFLTGEKDTDSGEWIKKSISQVSGVTETYDTTDDAAAKAVYDKRMHKAETIDTMLEMRLSQIEGEHRALEKEMESLESLVKDEIEKDFKTFG